MALTNQLIEKSDGAQKETLQGIQLGTRKMEILIRNLSYDQQLRNGSFVADKESFNPYTAIDKVV